LSIIDTPPIFKEETITLRVNVSHPNGTACNVADVSSTVILPNLTQNKLSLEKVGDGIYETSYYLDTGGRYIIDVHGSIPILNDSVEYIGGYDEEKLSVMSGYLDISLKSPPIGEEYKRYTTVNLIADVSCNDEPVEDANVMAAISTPDGTSYNINLIPTEEPGKYSGYCIPYTTGTYVISLNASAPFYLPSTYCVVGYFNATSDTATLEENLNKFAVESKSILDDFVVDMGSCRIEGNYFNEKVAEDRLSLVSDAAVSITLGWLGASSAAKEAKYLNKFAAPGTIIKNYAGRIIEEVGLETTTGITKMLFAEFVTDDPFNKFYNAFVDWVNDDKAEIDDALSGISIPSDMSTDNQEMGCAPKSRH